MEILNNDIRIRAFTDSDFTPMLKWLTDNRVLKYYGGRDKKYTLDSLTGHYKKPIEDGFRLIIEYKNIPIGYGQVYRLNGKLLKEYDYQDDNAVIYAMDQFIGEPNYWNRGIGSSYLMLMCEYLKKEKGADVVLVDPHKNNYRAIRAYEKAGNNLILLNCYQRMKCLKAKNKMAG